MSKTAKLILAPMAGFTDAPFRLLARHHGADFAVTEMISAVALTRRDKKTAALAKIPKGDCPIAIQIFGHEPEIMAKAAKMLAAENFNGCDFAEKPAAIDINMGCPVKKIVSCGDGSALMKNPSLCGEIVSAVKEAVKDYGTKVTVKIRAGYDSASVNAARVAKICVENGADGIAVHARTREEMYMPGIHPEVIRSVREALPENITVIGNGDISSAADAGEMLAVTGCDGLMIGRAALGNPWIFEEIKAHLEGRKFTPPSLSERMETAIQLVRDIVAEKGEETGIRESRGRAAHFIRGVRGSAAIRDRLNHARTLPEFEQTLINAIHNP